MARGQSAVEYLMTYGWAILVIVVVLAILFLFNVFNGGALSTGSCQSFSNFACTSTPILSGDGYLSVDLGNYGSEVIATGIACTNSSASAPVSFTPLQNIDMQSSLSYAVSVLCPIPGSTIGSRFNGILWMQYKSDGVGGLVAKVASISIAVSTQNPVTSTSTTSTSTTSTTSTTTIPCSNIVYSSNATLSNDVVTECNVTINSGVTLTTDGYSIIIGSNFDNLGMIDTGFSGNGGAQTTAYSQSYGNPGGNVGNAYGGSGGGGVGLCECGNYLGGGSGGSTLVGGGAGGSPGCGTSGASGATPAAPVLSSSMVVSWYSGGIQNYIGGAGGGSGAGVNGNGGDGCSGQDWYGGAGGSGAYGIYIQAYSIVEGTVVAGGQAGGNGGGGAGGAGAGGGGGTIVFAYGSGGLTAGSVITTGGSAGSGGGGAVAGTGGSGQVLTLSYGNSPPVTP